MVLNLHYDPDVVAALRTSAADLVLIRLVSGRYEIVEEASHDPDTALFRLSTTLPASWYGVAERSSLPVAVEPSSWGQVKASYR